MQVNRSVSNQQRWLLECQLVYLLFRISRVVFGSVMVGRIGQSDLWNLLLEELIFLLPLVLTWLGYKSQQAWCHYLAGATNAGIVIHFFASQDIRELSVFFNPIAFLVICTILYIPVVPVLYCAYQQFLVGRELSKRESRLKLAPTMGTKSLDRVLLGYLFVKGWLMVVIRFQYFLGLTYLLVTALWLATIHLTWWGYRHHRSDLLKLAWILDVVYLLMGIWPFVAAPIFYNLNYYETWMKVIFNLGWSVLFLIGLPALALLLLWKLKASVKGYVFGVTSHYQGAEAYQLQDLDQVLTQAETLSGQSIECRMIIDEKGFLGQVGDAYWFTFSQSTGGDDSARVLRVRVQGKVPQAISSWQGVLTLRGQVGYHETDSQAIPNGWFLDADWLAFVPDKN